MLANPLKGRVRSTMALVAALLVVGQLAEFDAFRFQTTVDIDHAASERQTIASQRTDHAASERQRKATQRIDLQLSNKNNATIGIDDSPASISVLSNLHKNGQIEGRNYTKYYLNTAVAKEEAKKFESKDAGAQSFFKDIEIKSKNNAIPSNLDTEQTQISADMADGDLTCTNTTDGPACCASRK
jgi:hypothetical protein